MLRSLKNRMLSWLDASTGSLGHGFIRAWTRIDRSYKRPLSQLALRLKFSFYVLLALGAIAWLGWDWSHARSLSSAENEIFDRVIHWRPFEPKPSGRVVVVEIDECSIEYFRARGEGGWPWSRQRHADLLEQLDRAGVRAIGYDVLFIDRSPVDPTGDRSLEAMAAGAGGRFIFASTRMHPDYDEGSPLRASQAPAAFALQAHPQIDPKVALQLPYGAAMARFSAIANVTRSPDGVLRDIPLRETVGDWALPSLPLRLAMAVTPRLPGSLAATVRPNWRLDTRLPRISAADLLTGGKAICRDARLALPGFKDRIALVGYTASGVNDAKPTPVDPVMSGVEVLAEATEALIADSAIRSPPEGLKYLIATLFVLLTTFTFFRGEPATEIDSIFVAINLALLSASFVGLTFFGFFFDIFSCIGFVSLVFGLCRAYAGVQRGRAVGNGDFLPEFDPAEDRWLAVARLRFVPDVQGDKKSAARRREYHRRVRRFLYAGSDAVMLEGVVERKSWLHEALSDVIMLVWHGEEETAAQTAALHDLARLEQQLAEFDPRLPADGSVRLAFACVEIDEDARDSDRGERLQLRELIGRVLASSTEWPLARHNEFSAPAGVTSGES